MGLKQKIKALIVDDSPTVRRVMTEILSSDPDIHVMGAASDAFSAARYISKEVPDVIFLDIEMPKMDGLTFMRKIMAQRPIPVVVCSAVAEEGTETFLQVLEAGAVDVVSKPRVDSAQFLQESRERICDVAKAAANAKPRTRHARPLKVEQRFTADVVLPPPSLRHKGGRGGDRIVCIGSSTGGTEAILEVLSGLPADSPGIVIVQHMPEGFTSTYARRLDSLCAIRVKEAESGDKVQRGLAILARGGHHLIVKRVSTIYSVEVIEGPPVSRHRPSVDVLFRSAAQAAGADAMGVILTGMGDDGARGLLEMRSQGSHTIAQNEETCVVFGMPNEAIKLGGAAVVLPLNKIANEIIHGHVPA